MGHVLAVVSQKGGVGKTTSAINLAAAFARTGLRTLLVDVDPQGAVRFGAGLQPGTGKAGLADYLSGQAHLREIIHPTILPWLRVILVGSVSEETDHSLFADRVAHTGVMAELLRIARERSEVTVVDTPPGLSPMVQRVLEECDRVIIPLQCEPLALQTTPQILRMIRDVSSAHEGLTLDGVLLTMYDANSPASARIAAYVRGHLPPHLVLETVIPRSEAAVDAFAAGQPVVVRTPSDPAAIAYQTVAEQLRASWR